MKILKNLKIFFCIILCFLLTAGSRIPSSIQSVSDNIEAGTGQHQSVSGIDGSSQSTAVSSPETETQSETDADSAVPDSPSSSGSAQSGSSQNGQSASSSVLSGSRPQSSSGSSSQSKPQSAVEKPSSSTPSSPQQTPPQSKTEIRAVWISFLEYQSILRGKSESSFKKAIASYFDKCVSYGLNTVIVHARSHSDAFYKSRYYPASVHFTGKRQNSFPFDPLKIMVAEAHKRGLKIEAWVNPYRGSHISETLAADDPVKKWLGTEKVFAFGEYYYLNPGEPEVRQLILNGIIELVDNYDIDGIHFDDYFYPTADSSIDKSTYNKYGGGKTLKVFRTDCVNKLVSSVYREIKNRKNITFGISPEGNIDNCLNKSFADVKLWGSTPGYVDYLAPQIYWDYDQKPLPYQKALSDWKKTVTSPKVRLITGHAAYRVVEIGTGGWATGDILKRQVLDARSASNYGGFIMFRYDFFFSGALAAERENLKGILN